MIDYRVMTTSEKMSHLNAVSGRRPAAAGRDLTQPVHALRATNRLNPLFIKGTIGPDRRYKIFDGEIIPAVSAQFPQTWRSSAS